MTTNKMQLFWLIYLFLISSKCFGRCLRPSSGTLDFIYSFCLPPMLLPDGTWMIWNCMISAGSSISGLNQKL